MKVVRSRDEFHAFDMATENKMNSLESTVDHWNKASDDQSWQAALTIAMKGYETALANGTRVDCLMFLGFIRVAAQQLFDQASIHNTGGAVDNDLCSFCLSKQANMVRGLNVAICRNCVESARSELT